MARLFHRDPGKVWVKATLTTGPQMEHDVYEQMPPDWTMASLRAALGDTMKWNGFGMPKAWEIDVNGNHTRELSIGAT